MALMMPLLSLLVGLVAGLIFLGMVVYFTVAVLVREHVATIADLQVRVGMMEQQWTDLYDRSLADDLDTDTRLRYSSASHDGEGGLLA